MITKIKAIVTESINPFFNISLEARLLDVCDKDTVFLYLWKNDKTVVVGKNQNAFKECKVNLLESEGGHLIRRLTGGGAVFHDVNNLNFTFVAHEDNYDLKKQQTVLLTAAKHLGINAEISGRNDILADGRKFSGNSFLTKGHVKMHNGTVLINTNHDEMAKYLTVSQAKMKSKGVDSVRSRVVNLIEFDNTLTTDKMAKVILQSFGEVYGMPVEMISQDQLDTTEIEKLKNDVFANDNFRFGRNPSFTNSVGKRFDWGEIEVVFQSDKGVITDVEVFSDALDTDAVQKTKEFLLGKELANLNKTKLDKENKVLIDTVSLF